MMTSWCDCSEDTYKKETTHRDGDYVYTEQMCYGCMQTWFTRKYLYEDAKSKFDLMVIS